MEYMNMLSAGVFLAGALLHMLPEANEAAESTIPDASLLAGRPVAFMIASAVFVAMAAVDYITGAHSHVEDNGLCSLHIVEDKELSDVESQASDAESSIPVAESVRPDYGEQQPPVDQPDDRPPAYPHTHSEHALMTCTEAGCQVDHCPYPARPHRHSPKARASMGPLRACLIPLFLLSALSFHSIVAGFGLGVLPYGSTARMSWVAIFAHKGLEAMALVASIVLHGAGVGVVAAVTVAYACITPLGYLLGAATHKLVEGAAKDAVVFVGVSLSAGTFLYVGLIELLAHTMHRDGHAAVGHRVGHMLSMALGVAAMTGLLFLEADE
ncbi:Zinc/iron permease [Carpediemonas membranifera]|nr:Zinc/iron permease [Carpediemonas membranifera]|eukprot:KAG9389891.1 Zinc/iron permease [Carpediemonas membranifera]